MGLPRGRARLADGSAGALRSGSLRLRAGRCLDCVADHDHRVGRPGAAQWRRGTANRCSGFGYRSRQRHGGGGNKSLAYSVFDSANDHQVGGGMAAIGSEGDYSFKVRLPVHGIDRHSSRADQFTITVMASDSAGNSGTDSATVAVTSTGHRGRGLDRGAHGGSGGNLNRLTLGGAGEGQSNNVSVPGSNDTVTQYITNTETNTVYITVTTTTTTNINTPPPPPHRHRHHRRLSIRHRRHHHRLARQRRRQDRRPSDTSRSSSSPLKVARTPEPTDKPGRNRNAR